jgi:hypothetical protein
MESIAVEANQILSPRCRRRDDPDRNAPRISRSWWVLVFALCLLFAGCGIDSRTLTADTPSEPKDSATENQADGSVDASSGECTGDSCVLPNPDGSSHADGANLDGADLDASSIGSDSADSADGRMAGTFGSVCRSDDDCKTIGPSFFCMKIFDIFTIPDGLCTRPCQSTSQTDCAEIAGACASERSGSNDASATPRSVCFPTCKLDVPCRSGLKCQFVYRNNMLVEPSVCVPDNGDAAADQ